MPESQQERLVDYTNPHLNEAEVFCALRSHEAFEIQPGHVIKGLPKFTEFGVYFDLKDEKELELCELEARRLVRIANSDEPVQMQCRSDLFGPATQEGYLQLHQLGCRLQTSLIICIHDTELVMAENLNAVDNYVAVAKLQAKLQDQFDLTTGELRYSGAPVADDEDTARRLHALVNHLTAILVKVILQSLRGKYWEVNIVAAVARVAAKLKVLSVDLPRAVEQAFQKSNDARQRISLQEQYVRRHALKRREEYMQDMPEGTKAGPRHTRVGEAAKYFFEMYMLHDCIIAMLQGSVVDLAVGDPQAPGTNEFESSVALYESSVTNEQVLLCEQRDGGIGAASDSGTIHAFTAGWQVCLQSWKALEKTEAVNGNTDESTSIKWRCSHVDVQPKEVKAAAAAAAAAGDSTSPSHEYREAGAVRLTSMKSVIMATVPYSMITPTSASSLHMLIDILIFKSGRASHTSVFLVKQPKTICHAIIHTSKYESNRPSTVREHDACSVSETFLLQRRAVLDPDMTGSSAAKAPSPANVAEVPPNGGSKRKAEQKNEKGGQQTANKARMKEVDFSQQYRRENKQAIEEVMAKLNTWTIDDDAIVVPYKIYAWGSIGVSGVFVVGGLAIGFSIGERLPGVDPFNITVFCWVLAGFLLLVAKAVRVESWPWSNFLEGIVTCRSVREVVAVTGVNEQVLLAVLLRLDNRIYLRTRGPFNTLFMRQSSDGFSINVPIKSSTAIEGGLIPIKILADWGPGLVFINTRSWTTYNSVSHTGRYTGGLISRDVTQPSLWHPDTKTSCYRLVRTKSEEKVDVTRVLGVFKQDCYFY